MTKAERKEREFNMRRTEILSAAEKIFAAKSFHDVTMAEIAKVSGFSIGSLYQFFTSKEELYTSMVSEKIELIFAEIRKATESSREVLEKIKMLIEAHLTFVEKNTEFLLLFIKGEKFALSDSMNSLRQKLIDSYQQHITFIENMLRNGIRAGILRNLPPRHMAEALFYLIRASAMRWILMPTAESLKSQKDFILDIFLHGVENDKR